jgi:hypothetical protein
VLDTSTVKQFLAHRQLAVVGVSGELDGAAGAGLGITLIRARIR